MPFNPATHQILRFESRHVDCVKLLYFLEALCHTNLTVQNVRNAVQARAAEIYLPKFSRDTRLHADIYCLAPDDEPWGHYWNDIAFVLQLRQTNTSGSGQNGNSQSKNDVELDPQNLLKITNAARALLKLLKDVHWEHKKIYKKRFRTLV